MLICLAVAGLQMYRQQIQTHCNTVLTEFMRNYVTWEISIHWFYGYCMILKAILFSSESTVPLPQLVYSVKIIMREVCTSPCMFVGLSWQRAIWVSMTFMGRFAGSDTVLSYHVFFCRCPYKDECWALSPLSSCQIWYASLKDTAS